MNVSGYVYGASEPAWILEVLHYSETSWRRVERPALSASLAKVEAASRTYFGGDCSIRARNILDGRTIDLRRRLSVAI